MSASMTENLSRRLMNPGISQVHKDVSDERYRDLRRPRKVRFFVNGDRFFKGKKLYITPHRYYNFNDLLNDLTGKLPSSINLPYGVRQIFTPVGGRRVSDIEDLQDGETYVCAGFEGFKVIKYGRTDLEPWSVGKTVRLSHLQDAGDASSEAGSYASYKYRGYASTNAFHPGRYYRSNAAQSNHANMQRRWPGTFGNQQRYLAATVPLGGPGEVIAVKPKLITIIRNGGRPRDSVKMFLNQRSIQSYEQLISDISEAFGFKWKHSRVQKLYTMRGKEVKGVSDFYREDDCFIALGGGEHFNDNDIVDVINELFPDSAYAKLLLKDLEKQRRRDKKANTTKDNEGEKMDHGLGEGFGDNVAQDYEVESPHQSQAHTHHSKRRDHDYIPSEAGSPQGYYMLSKLERERRQAATEHREKARRRKNKLVERERRALEEERRRRGLPPLNPFKPLDDIQRREPKDKDQVQRQKEEDARRKLEEEKEAKRTHQEREEREKAVQAARERMAAAEKAEKERKDKEHKEHGVDGKRVEQDSKTETDEQQKAKDEIDATIAVEKISEQDNSMDNGKPTEKQDKDQDKEMDSVREEPEKKQKKVNITNKNIQRKSKPKVIRRSKMERQISSDSFITERYDLSRTLGDGNFAIVKIARLKSTGQEFAMKVIDKPKLKGKEHMVENEIEVMKDCSHPNIVKLYEEFETNDKIYLVMELVKGGDLFDAITQSVKFGEVDSAGMVRDMCNALYYLHSRSIIHRDLKPENLLVHRNMDGTITLKLADFGLAMEMKEDIFTVCGTPTYVAPEILTENGYNLEVDMWAVGVITYILLCGFPPFRSPDRNQTELFEFIKAGEYEFLSPYWDNVSEVAKDLIRRLLVVDRKRRYTAIDVLSHPWVVCGGNPHRPLPGIASLGAYCKEVRRDLEEQAKHNYLSYQRMKESRIQEE